MKNLKTILKSDLTNPMRKNHVLVVVKPGFESLNAKLCSLFTQYNYSIVKAKTTKLTLEQAKELYKVHKKEDFYNSLCEYMSSGLTTAFILCKKSDNIFKEFGKLKDEIREKYGESEMRNVLHSSDSYENFVHEASIYFYIP